MLAMLAGIATLVLLFGASRNKHFDLAQSYGIAKTTVEHVLSDVMMTSQVGHSLGIHDEGLGTSCWKVLVESGFQFFGSWSLL